MSQDENRVARGDGRVNPGALRPEHRKQLVEDSGIAPEVVSARGYRSVQGHQAFGYGFSKAQARAGLLMPVWPPGCSEPPLHVLRPDEPRTKDGKAVKYEMPRGKPIRVDCPRLLADRLRDPTRPLWITEGIKKGDSLASAILKESRPDAVLALIGVWAFKTGTELGGTVVSADLDYVNLKDRVVRIVYDSDVMTKGTVHQALRRLTEHLQRKGARVLWCFLQATPGQKVGVDDYLVRGGSLGDLEALARGPTEEAPVAPPIETLVREAPITMDALLLSHEGRSYLATSLWIRTEVKEEKREGQATRLAQPKVMMERRWGVLRDDGVLFGSGCDLPLADLPFTLSLPEDPGPIAVMDAQGIESHRAGRAEGAPALFAMVTGCFDHFLDFARSLAPQEAMARLCALWVFATYISPGLSVAPYIFWTGPWGSGKTRSLEVLSRLAFGATGSVLEPSTTIATLRELAKLGTSLVLDEASRFVSREADPEKRSIVLAGNRRGAKVALQVPKGRRGWETAWVSVFAPRAFAAQGQPDPTFSSRCLVVPLVRTLDHGKSARSPARPESWPHDPKGIVRSLWSWALRNLGKVPQAEAKAWDALSLPGRAAEPWIPLVTAALLLAGEGVDVAQDLLDLSVAYQGERETLTEPDLYALIVRALCELWDRDRTNDGGDGSDGSDGKFPDLPLGSDDAAGARWWGVAEIRDKVRDLLGAENVGGTDISPERTGRHCATLRLRHKRTGRNRKWGCDLDQLSSLARAHLSPSWVASYPWLGPVIPKPTVTTVTTVTPSQTQTPTEKPCDPGAGTLGEGDAPAAPPSRQEEMRTCGTCALRAGGRCAVVIPSKAVRMDSPVCERYRPDERGGPGVP